MKAVIVDDKARLRNTLSTLLDKYIPEVTVVGEADGVESAGILIRQVNPDLVFLDVEMEDGTGFDLLAEFSTAEFQVIFVTAHDHYALKAIKYSAIDYLLKPVDINELKAAVAKAHEQHSQNNKNQKKAIQALLHNRTASEPNKKIVLTDSDAIYLVEKNEIKRCQSEGNYTKFFLVNDRNILVSKTMKEYIPLLEDNNFLRIHQSHLINLDFFSHYEKAHGGQLYMKDGTLLPVAVRRKEALFKALKNQ